MKQKESRQKELSDDLPEHSPKECRSAHKYMQGLLMGAYLFLLCNFPDVLILSLTSSGEARFLTWWYPLLLCLLIVLWISLVLTISSNFQRDTPQAYGLVTMLLLWLAEQAGLFLLARQRV
ncbi:MAG TPA: hypothetical protein VFN35_16550 [Ktedonobacteraceae bacterium]|nr:hypothetical protein [Ktedonobacteraceae bacterium]